MNNGIYSIANQYISSINGDSKSSSRPIQNIGKLNNQLNWTQIGSNGWDAISDSIRETISNFNTFKPVRFVQRASFVGGTNPYINGVLMPNGKIMLCPFNSTTALIYDPYDDKTFVPAGTYAGTSSFSAGVLLPSGEVLFIPRRVACTVYNPYTNTIRTIGSAPATDAYASGVLLQDGRVYCIPNTSTTALIIDPIKNTSFVPSGTFTDANVVQTNGLSLGVLLLPDGRLLTTVNRNAGFCGIYDPRNNTFKRTQCPNNFGAGAVLMPDGTVIIPPNSLQSGGSLNIAIYDYQRDTIRYSKFAFPGLNGSGSGAILLPDGRIFIINSATGSHTIYNPYTDTRINAPGTSTGSDFTGGTTLPDGRLILYPRNSTTCVGYGEKGRGFSIEFLLSAYSNYRK
jgi:hypothetical protein